MVCLDYTASSPSCDRVLSVEAQTAQRMGREVSPVLGTACTSTLSTRSQDGKGGTACIRQVKFMLKLFLGS